MTITNCPKCGSMNITTAGICENCGWSPFAQVALCTRITGEMELKVSGKALLDDYKRLLFENRNLTARIAELEAESERFTVHDATERQDDKCSKPEPNVCEACGGDGTVLLTDGYEGKVIATAKCIYCNGTGRVNKEREE